MYCPKCGQQARERVRFCSHCGFPLDPVNELIANIGTITSRDTAPQKKELSERRKGIRRGAQILFLSLVLFPITFGIAIGADTPGPLVLPFTVFIAGVLWMLYFRLFGDDTPIATNQPLPHQMNAMPPRSALPAPYENSVSGLYTPPRNTADMMERPNSVTETTTKLLDDN